MSLELSSNDVEASGVDAELPLPSEFEPQTSNQAGMPEGHFEDSDLGTWGRHDDRTTFQKAVDFLPSFPFITWVPKYTQEKFTADVIASLIITVMLVPQSMAYAQLAGLDPIYGLYSSTIPLIVYPLFGTSHEMAIGPVAIISILNAEAVLAVSGVEAGSTRATELSHLLAFLVGMIQCVLGILHAGYITNFLSHPVLEGFISGAAIIIGTSQVSKLFGYKIPRSPYVFETWFNIFKNIKQIHWLTVGIGLESIVLLKVFQRLKQTKFTSENLQKLFKYLPGTLVVIILNIILVAALDLSDKGLKVVGEVPGGFPSFGAPFVTDNVSSDIASLLPSAFIISIIGFIESIGVAKSTSSRRGYSVNSTQELMGVGISNIGGSFFKSYSVAGGLSRTAVNASAGCSTAMSGLMTGIIISIVIVSITGAFENIPDASLASIIVVAVAQMFKVSELKYFWRTKRADFWVFLFSFTATLVVGIEIGVGLGCAFSLLRVIKRSSMPHWARLGRLPGTTTFRNYLRNPDAILTPGVEIIRIDAALYFANTAFVEELAYKAINWTKNVQYLVIDMAAVANVDSSATHALEELDAQLLKASKVKLLYATIRGPVRDTFDAAGYLEHIMTEGRLFESVHDANKHARASLGFDEEESDLDLATLASVANTPLLSENSGTL